MILLSEKALTFQKAVDIAVPMKKIAAKEVKELNENLNVIH